MANKTGLIRRQWLQMCFYFAKFILRKALKLAQIFHQALYFNMSSSGKKCTMSRNLPHFAPLATKFDEISLLRVSTLLL